MADWVIQAWHNMLYISGARRVLNKRWGSLFDLKYWGWHRNFNYPFSAPSPPSTPLPVYIDQRPLFVHIFGSPDFAKDSYPLNTITSGSWWWWTAISSGVNFARDIGGLGHTLRWNQSHFFPSVKVVVTWKDALNYGGKRLSSYILLDNEGIG